MRGLQFAEDASPMAHPIRPDKVIEMNNFYTLTVYEKGSEIIRMIHTLLGEENFQKGMQLYFERHDGSAATCDDFVQAMEDASISISPTSAAGTARPGRRLSPSKTITTRRPSSTP
jgi:aminopeptidase N